MQITITINKIKETYNIPVGNFLRDKAQLLACNEELINTILEKSLHDVYKKELTRLRNKTGLDQQSTLTNVLNFKEVSCLYLTTQQRKNQETIQTGLTQLNENQMNRLMKLLTKK